MYRLSARQPLHAKLGRRTLRHISNRTMYDLIQSALTATIESVAIAGFGGIALHAFWTSHCNWMAKYCPPVAPPTPDAQPLTENLLIEIFKGAGSGEANALYTPDTQEPEAIAPEPQQPEIDLNALAPTTLRKLCTQHQIAWRHARGKNRHATKAMMIFQLQQLKACDMGVQNA